MYIRYSLQLHMSAHVFTQFVFASLCVCVSGQFFIQQIKLMQGSMLQQGYKLAVTTTLSFKKDFVFKLSFTQHPHINMYCSTCHSTWHEPGSNVTKGAEPNVEHRFIRGGVHTSESCHLSQRAEKLILCFASSGSNFRISQFKYNIILRPGEIAIVYHGDSNINVWGILSLATSSVEYGPTHQIRSHVRSTRISKSTM